MSSNRVPRMFWRLSAVHIGVLLLAGCQGAKVDGGAAQTSNPPTSQPARSEVAALDHIDEANFQITWTLLQPADEGRVGSGELVLVAKSPFKPNQEYPHKFKLTGSDLTTKAEVAKPEMKVSLDRVVVPVSFEVTGPKPTLEGNLAFSVCTAEACLIERKDIRLSVRVPSAGSLPAVGAAPTVTAAATAGK